MADSEESLAEVELNDISCSLACPQIPSTASVGVTALLAALGVPCNYQLLVRFGFPNITPACTCDDF